MPQHRNRTAFSIPKRDLALTKLRVLGIKEPPVLTDDPDHKSRLRWVPYSKAPVALQRRHWSWVLDALREAAAKANVEEHKKRNAQNT